MGPTKYYTRQDCVKNLLHGPITKFYTRQCVVFFRSYLLKRTPLPYVFFNIPDLGTPSKFQWVKLRVLNVTRLLSWYC